MRRITAASKALVKVVCLGKPWLEPSGTLTLAALSSGRPDGSSMPCKDARYRSYLVNGRSHHC
jgi:hypothetical protein